MPLVMNPWRCSSWVDSDALEPVGSSGLTERGGGARHWIDVADPVWCLQISGSLALNVTASARRHERTCPVPAGEQQVSVFALLDPPWSQVLMSLKARVTIS
jgi:hypothetical protein